MGWLFAKVYDRLMVSAEEQSLGWLRDDLLRPIRGEVLELGAGTGTNLRHYGPGVTRLELTEPSAAMRRRLSARLADSKWAAHGRIHDAAAESLPFPDASLDWVVSTLVLCSVRDQARVLAEVRRVLRASGRLVVLEHVRHSDLGSRTLQTLVDPLWRLCADGCRLVRDTEQAILDAGFRFERRSDERLRPGAPFLRQLLCSVARP